MSEQPTIPGLESAGHAFGDPISAAVDGINAGIQALRDAGVIQPHHEADIAFIYANLNSAITARGIARGNFLKEARDAFKGLPEPTIEEGSERQQTELERIAEYIQHLEQEPDPADVPDTAQPAQVD